MKVQLKSRKTTIGTLFSVLILAILVAACAPTGVQIPASGTQPAVVGSPTMVASSTSMFTKTPATNTPAAATNTPAAKIAASATPTVNALLAGVATQDAPSGTADALCKSGKAPGALCGKAKDNAVRQLASGELPGIHTITENGTNIGPWVTCTKTNDLAAYEKGLLVQTEWTLAAGETVTFDCIFETVLWDRGDEGLQPFSTYHAANSCIVANDDGVWGAFDMASGIVLSSKDPSQKISIDYHDGRGVLTGTNVEFVPDVLMTITRTCDRSDGVCVYGVGQYGASYNIFTGVETTSNCGNEAAPDVRGPAVKGSGDSSFDVRSWLDMLYSK